MMKHISLAALSRKLVLLAFYILLLGLFSACHVIPGDEPRLISLKGGDRQGAAEGGVTQQKPGLAASSNQAEASASEANLAKPRYVIQYGSPAYTKDFTHVGQVCSWMGVAGQVFDFNGNPAANMKVRLGGTISGQAVSGTGSTGGATAYGPGGYEILLASKLADSTGTLWAQVLDANGVAHSDRYYFNTTNDCNQAVVIINFEEDLPYKRYLPIIAN